MKITLNSHKHYTTSGRIAILEYQTGNRFKGRVTQTAKKSEVLNVVWTDEGECLTSPEYDLLHTVNYHQLAELIKVTYAMITIAQGTGKLGLTPIFPKNREKVFDKATVLKLVTEKGKIVFRCYVAHLYKEELFKGRLKKKHKDATSIVNKKETINISFHI